MSSSLFFPSPVFYHKQSVRSTGCHTGGKWRASSAVFEADWMEPRVATGYRVWESQQPGHGTGRNRLSKNPHSSSVADRWSAWGEREHSHTDYCTPGLPLRQWPQWTTAQKNKLHCRRENKKSILLVSHTCFPTVQAELSSSIAKLFDRALKTRTVTGEWRLIYWNTQILMALWVLFFHRKVAEIVQWNLINLDSPTVTFYSICFISFYIFIFFVVVAEPLEGNLWILFFMGLSAWIPVPEFYFPKGNNYLDIFSLFETSPFNFSNGW